MAKMGRPLQNFDKRTFVDLVGLGCTEDEICWVFRDENGKPANRDTLSRWCKRTFGQTFQEFSMQNKHMMLRIKLRKNQLKLSEKSAAMAIWLGKQCLGQKDNIVIDNGSGNGMLADLIDGLRDQSLSEENDR